MSDWARRSLLQCEPSSGSSSSDDESSIISPCVLGGNRFIPTVDTEDMRDPRGGGFPETISMGACMKATHPIPGDAAMEAPTSSKSVPIYPCLCDLSAHPMSDAKSRKTSSADFGGFGRPITFPQRHTCPIHARMRFLEYRGCALRARNRRFPITLWISRRDFGEIVRVVARRLSPQGKRAVQTYPKARHRADNLGRT